MQNTTRRLFPLIIGGFLFLADRTLKMAALGVWQHDVLFSKWFGWHPFLNSGAAFGLPVPQVVTASLTVPIILLVVVFAWRVALEKPVQSFGLWMLFFGALSNLLDRVTLNQTIDYVLILTGVFNVADAMILVGFILYLRYYTSNNAHEHQ